MRKSTQTRGEKGEKKGGKGGLGGRRGGGGGGGVEQVRKTKSGTWESNCHRRRITKKENVQEKIQKHVNKMKDIDNEETDEEEEKEEEEGIT